MSQLIYFARPVGTDGPVKIGISSNPYVRVRSLQGGCPLPLEIVATVEGDKTLERRFHAYFSETHSHCEWFAASEKMTNTIMRINQGLFRVKSLPDPTRISRKRGGAAYAQDAAA